MSSGKLIDVHLGFLILQGTISPYEQKVIKGELILKNQSSETLSFVDVILENSSEGTILSKPRYYIPTLLPDESISISFRLAFLQENFEMIVKTRFDSQSFGSVKDAYYLTIPGEAGIGRESHLVFISYCTKDLYDIQHILDRIKSNHFRIWVAAHQIGETEWFPDAVQSALDEADVFVIFLSDNSVNSFWVINEIKIAVQKLQAGELKHIIPVKINECEIPISDVDFQPVNFSDKNEEAIDEILNRLSLCIN